MENKEQMDESRIENAFRKLFAEYAEHGHLGDEPYFDACMTFFRAELATEKKELLREIDRHFEVRTDGTAGCTWGDTDYDSKSVAYGMNKAYEEIQTVLRKIADKIGIDLENYQETMCECLCGKNEIDHEHWRCERDGIDCKS